jgi:hypothetical protein
MAVGIDHGNIVHESISPMRQNAVKAQGSE